MKKVWATLLTWILASSLLMAGVSPVRIANLVNLTNTGTGLVDVTTATIRTGIQTSGATYLAGFYACTFQLVVTSITGTTPTATIKIDIGPNGTNYTNVISFTAATAATSEIKSIASGGAISLNDIRITRDSATGTLTNLNYEVWAICAN